MSVIVQVRMERRRNVDGRASRADGRLPRVVAPTGENYRKLLTWFDGTAIN